MADGAHDLARLPEFADQSLGVFVRGQVVHRCHSQWTEALNEERKGNLSGVLTSMTPGETDRIKLARTT